MPWRAWPRPRCSGSETMRPKAILVMLAAAPVAAFGAEPRFEPRAQHLTHVYDGGWEHFVGGGLAVFDCDDDGLPELYSAGGANPASLMRNRSARGLLDFVEDTPDGLAITGVTGAWPIDLDGDGQLDLAVMRVGPNVWLKGGPDCAFEPMDGLPDGGDAWSTAFSATWEAGQDRPTLAVGNYVDLADPDGPFGTCDDNQLIRGQGLGWADPVTLPGHCALSLLFSDWARTGRADLRVSNDRHYYVRGGQEQLWAMGPTPRLYGEADGWIAHALWGMGIASRDITGDGLPEVYLSSMGDQRLQIAEGPGPVWRDAPWGWGTAAHVPHTGGDGRPSTGWHTAFGDVNNDGWDDLFVAKGNVEQMPGNAMKDPNSLLLRRGPAQFEEVSVEAGVASDHRGRGAGLVDLDGDGRLDLAVVNRRAAIEIWQNVTPDAGGWLTVDVQQPGPNTRAVGAWIELALPDGRVLAREITVGGGHGGGAAMAEHFGLGDAATARLRVIWTDGQSSGWHDVDAGSSYRVERSGDALRIGTAAGMR